MPWWFWTLLWILLVVVALAILVYLVVRLVMKGIQVLDEFIKFSDIASQALDDSNNYQTQRLRDKPEVAIFRPVSKTFAEYEQSKNERIQRRISRRIHKRETLGQPQNVSDLRKTSRKGATHG